MPNHVGSSPFSAKNESLIVYCGGSWHLTEQEELGRKLILEGGGREYFSLSFISFISFHILFSFCFLDINEKIYPIVPRINKDKL